MKITIPFKMFGQEGGEIVLDFPASAYYVVAKNREEIEEEAVKDAEQAGRYLGKFKDEFQRILLGYERCPGIENVYWTLKLCAEDEILQKRIMELKRAALVKKNDEQQNNAEHNEA